MILCYFCCYHGYFSTLLLPWFYYYLFQNQLYTLVVSATDAGIEPKTSSVLVYFNVKDVNDNTPLFEHGTYDAAVYENVTIGTSVLQVVAFDIDSGVYICVLSLYIVCAQDCPKFSYLKDSDSSVFTLAPL